MMPPSMRRAAVDPELRGAPLAVLVYLTDQLDWMEYRPVKIASLASSCHLKPVTAAWAVQRLIGAGYLRAGRKRDRVKTYRLVWAGREEASEDEATREKSA